MDVHVLIFYIHSLVVLCFNIRAFTSSCLLEKDLYWTCLTASFLKKSGKFLKQLKITSLIFCFFHDLLFHTWLGGWIHMLWQLSAFAWSWKSVTISVAQ